MYFIYVLQSEINNNLYIGVSSCIERRIGEHNAGKTRSTKPHIPYRLIYSESYTCKTDALKRERQIKKSGKIRKAIKEGKYKALSSSG